MHTEEFLSHLLGNWVYNTGTHLGQGSDRSQLSTQALGQKRHVLIHVSYRAVDEHVVTNRLLKQPCMGDKPAEAKICAAHS